VDALKQAYERAVEVSQDLSGWNLIGELNGIFSYSRPTPGTDLLTLKINFFVDKPPEFISKYIFDNWGDINQEF
jgi:hypothetical protein